MLGSIGSAILEALSMAFGMTWEILWALVLGFSLSGVVQAAVTKAEITRVLPDDSPKSIGIACGLGAASSSCSYAAVALARSIFRKGADFTAAMAFEFASTNLGILMVIILALLFRPLLTPKLVELARRSAERQVRSYMQGHGEMDMSVHEGS